MNLYHLKTFYYVARHGSLTRAAEALCITQPAVSKQIHQLQEQHELRLFNPVGKKMVLTDAGRALYGIAEKILELENRAEESIRDYQQQRRGHLSILAGESFGAYYLPDIIIEYSRLHPDIFISAEVLPHSAVVEHIARFRNDLGFVSSPVDHPKVVCREILQDSLILIVPPGHPLAARAKAEPQHLQGLPFIMHEKGSATRRIVDTFLRKNYLNIRMRSEQSNNESIKRMVENGLGLALISRNIARSELASGRLEAVEVEDSTLKRQYYRVHHREKYISRSLQQFIEVVDSFSHRTEWTARPPHPADGRSDHPGPAPSPPSGQPSS